MNIIKEFDKYLTERNKNSFSYAMRTVENFVQWAESRGYLSASQQSFVSEETCPNCGKNYFVEETIVDGELACSCARR